MMFNMRLKECIEESGMSANKIGDMAGLGHNSIYRIVGGYGVPRRSTVQKIADALGVNVEYLMGTSDTKFIVKNDMKNAEGYNDPTAYKAIKNVETDTGYLRGDIFEYEMKHGKEMRYALVVSANERCNDRFISIVLINDKAMGTNNVSLKVNAMMYADCDRVTFAPSASLKGFVRTATAEEMEEIDKAICMGLGIERIEMPKPGVAEEEMRRLYEEAEKARLEIEEKDDKMEAMRDEFMNLREGYICQEEKIEKLKAELEKEKKHQIVHSEWNLKFACDFYKKQYESLLAKILERAV